MIDTGVRSKAVICLLAVLVVVMLPLGLLSGSVDIPAGSVFDALCGDGSVNRVWRVIVVETRLPAILTSALAGAALAVSGLLMQTCFNNPLAGPTIMGVSSGASLGAAVALMAFGGALGAFGRVATAGGAFAGAAVIIFVLLLFSGVVRSSELLLIVGILVGYLTSSVISLLNFFATQESVHSFVMWGLGSFSGVASGSLPLFAGLLLLLLAASAMYVKQLNAMLLGTRYAENVGVRVRRVRTVLLLLSGGLTAVVTAWCGPIGFIGLVVPHIARLLTASSNHAVVLPATALAGALVGLLCQIVSVGCGITGGVLPINAITPVFGVPVILYVLVNRRKLNYFN